MSFPQDVSVNIHTDKTGDGQKLFSVKIKSGDVFAVASSPKMRLAIMKAVDSFETEYTKYIENKMKLIDAQKIKLKNKLVE